jgi:hypothetical protein
MEDQCNFELHPISIISQFYLSLEQTWQNSEDWKNITAEIYIMKYFVSASVYHKKHIIAFSEMLIVNQVILFQT